METAAVLTSPRQESSYRPITHGFRSLKGLPSKCCDKTMEIARMTKKLGKDDPRRIAHSLKVGLALTLVSLFYYLKPLYDVFGENGIWAVITVVFVSEFSVGATLGKGLNRMLGTSLAGALGVGAHFLATLSGRGEPIFTAIFVFVVAVITTFIRFFPRMKRYDYGLLIFILTFSMLSVSGYRDDQILKMAHQRISTILVASCASIIVCVCIFPVWIGDDLHNSVAANIQKLGNFLEAFGDEYFKVYEEVDRSDANNNKSNLQGYRSVLTSKGSEETMANFARWELIGHGRFGFRHPWKMYLKIGDLARDCAYKVEALNSYLKCKIQTRAEIHGRLEVEGPCKRVCIECSRSLKALSSTVRKMVPTISATKHIESTREAAEELKSLLGTSFWEEADLLEIIPAASVASLLLEIIECIEKIGEAVNELAQAASFGNSDASATVLPENSDSIQQGSSIQQDSNTAMTVSHAVIMVAE